MPGQSSFLSRLAAHGDDVAVVTDGLAFGYGELVRRVEARAGGLQSLGVGPGSVVGLELADEVEHLIASLALIAVGARHVTRPTHDPAEAKQALSERVRATHVLTVDGVAARDGVPSEASGAEGIVYLKTSGTTGGMNVIAFTATQLAEQAQRHPEYASERLLRLASIEHNNSKRHRLYCALMGGTNVFRPSGEFDVAEFCARHGVTCLDISRMHASDLAAQGGIGRFDGVKLRTGGSAVPIDVRRAIEERVTPLLYVRYASTESGAIAMAGPGEHDEMESVGRPLLACNWRSSIRTATRCRQAKPAASVCGPQVWPPATSMAVSRPPAGFAMAGSGRATWGCCGLMAASWCRGGRTI